MERGKRFIYFLTLLLTIFSPLLSFGEVIYKGVKITKFPAPALPKDFEPPDWRNYPWFSPGKEKFDINQPNGVEKLIWIVRDKIDAGWSYHGGSFTMDQNRFGHVRKMVSNRAIIYYSNDYKEFLSYNEGKIKAGDREWKDIIYFSEPSQMRGLASLTYKYIETPAVKKEQDRWVYVPALRRTRRLAAGADDDKLGGTDMSVDDVGANREVWEEEYVLLGEDQLGPEEHSLLAQEPKGPYGKYLKLQYRPKKGFNCWVVAAVNRKPRYYFPFRILWLDKDNQIIVREEQYDFHGYLWKIYDMGFQNFKKVVDPEGLPEIFYWNKQYYNIWDIKINHRSSFHIFGQIFNENSFLKWVGKGNSPESFFDVKRLEREEWGVEPPKAPKEIKTLDEYVPRPKLLRDRFKQFRKIILPEELEKKLIEEYGE